MQTSLQNSKQQALKSTQELSGLLEMVLDLSKGEGASDAVVAISHDQGFSVDVRMGQVDTVAFNEDQSMGLTVYFGQRKGSASSSDLTMDALKAMVTAACDIAKVSAADPCFGLPDQSLLVSHYPDLDLYHPWAITPSEAIEKALSCEHQARALDARIVNSDGVNLSTYNSLEGMFTSQGFRAFLPNSRHSISCSLIAQDERGMQSDYDYTTARHPDDLASLSQLASNAVHYATQRLQARKIKTQKCPVVFSSRVAPRLFSYFIGAISGNNLYRKQSFLLNAMDQFIFPKFVNVYEQPHLLRGLGSSPYDGEGVLTRNNRFIEQGRLNQYALGSYAARKMGLKTTANASGVSNLTIDSNAKELDDVLQKMDKGILVTDLMGQGVNMVTGDYSQGASGFWVENGKIQYPVEEMTIAGNLKDMFANIIAIGCDRNPNYSTRCGSVLLAEIMVAGI